jgi:putative membrane protein
MISNRTCHKTLFYSAVVLLGSVRAFAQNTSSTQPIQADLPRLGSTDPGANAVHSFGDQSFVHSVMEETVAETQLGKLAQQNSQSDDVKQLGQSLIENSAQLQADFKLLAQRLEVSPPKGPSKKDKQIIAKLEGMSGRQFDEEYINAVLKRYRQDVKDFQAESQTSQDPYVAQAAEHDVNAISQHLHATEEIAQKHNVGVDARK